MGEGDVEAPILSCIDLFPKICISMFHLLYFFARRPQFSETHRDVIGESSENR
jgi:hypothetical protein